MSPQSISSGFQLPLALIAGKATRIVWPWSRWQRLRVDPPNGRLATAEEALRESAVRRVEDVQDESLEYDEDDNS